MSVKTGSRKKAIATARAKRRRSAKSRKQAIDPISAAAIRGAFEMLPAEYDIDEIEAHVAELGEQAWSSHWGPYCQVKCSPRLRAYAVGLAMGLNEAADPPGTRAEAYEEGDPGEVEFGKLISSLGQEFARLARIPADRQHEFLLALRHMLPLWVSQVELGGDRVFLDLLKKTKRDAAAVYKDFEKLYRYVEPSEVYSMRLMPSIIFRMLFYLQAIDYGIDSQLPWRERAGRKGRREGRDQYPDLNNLIFTLEMAARRAGGGFGIPNKKLKKGRLIQALDLLRASVAGSNHWSWLAEFLPTPAQHPFSVYENALLRAYRMVTWIKQQVKDVGNETLEDLDPAVRSMRAYARTMRYIVDG
jgi:hypothetical protein